MKIRLKLISEYTIIKDKIQNRKICLKYMWPLLINRFFWGVGSVWVYSRKKKCKWRTKITLVVVKNDNS